MNFISSTSLGALKLVSLLFGVLIVLALIIFVCYRLLNKFLRTNKPEVYRWWTIVYYGARGSGKSLHQAKIALECFKYWDKLYGYDEKTGIPLPKGNKKIHQAIMFSIQKFSPDIEKRYAVWTYGTKTEIKRDGSSHEVIDFAKRTLNNANGYLYYWNDANDLQYCPRINCWKGKSKHRLHGCVLIIDDAATIFPAKDWQSTPNWLIKTFAQGRHFGIRILSNMQDPESVSIHFKRCMDMVYRFNKVIGSPDPDETQIPIRHIWGFYVRRKIKANLFWKFGDMDEQEISVMKEKQKRQQEIDGKHFYSGVWSATPHWIGKKICAIYDTTQDVPEYVPIGYSHRELGCIDPGHNHVDKKAPNYCGFSKVIHDLI